MKIKVITVATYYTENVKALERSCIRNGMDLMILGLDHQWQGFGMKVALTRDYLRTLEGYTHFIFVDAYDTLFLKPITKVPDHIFFSTEKQPWPDEDAPYPDKQDGTWKYLNSGIYSAPIKEWLKMVDENPITYADDDQRYFTSIYLGKPGSITLDTNCSLFQSYAFKSEGDFTIDNGIRNNKTKTTPAIIHFNGKCIDKKIYDMVEFTTLQEAKDRWRNTLEFAKEIHEAFAKKTTDTSFLNDHRTWVELHIFGFGERSFHWMWNLIVKELPKDFTFLEVGVFKGQTLSLIKLIADQQKKKVKRYGVTPLSTEGGVWESDYKKDIETIHDKFNLAKDYELLVGLSEMPDIIKKAASLKLDVLYIDGGHEERHITNDIDNYAHLVKPGGYMIIDDCCNSFAMPFGYFQGIESVTRVVDAKLPPQTLSDEWEFLFSVVHNRVYKRK